jgi:glycosyltransferase involved in cell wall biosynthesis
VHVGVVVYGALDRRSGGYLYDREVADRLEAAGDRVSVVSLPERDGLAAHAHNLVPALRHRIEALDADAVLVDELCHPSLWWALARLETPATLVAVVHHLRSSEGLGGWRARLVGGLERRFLRAADAYVYNGRTTRETVGALIDPDPSVIAPPGGDRLGHTVAPDRVRERAHEGPLRVVAVGGIEPRKGHDALIAGLSRVPVPWRLTVVGGERDAGYAAGLRRLAADRGVKDRITFAGRLADPALAAALAESHVFALPSRYEGYGIAYVEAMGCGLPAVATTAGGAGEVITDGEDGLLVPPDDPGAVADALAPLARDRDRLAAMGVAARERYDRHPTWDDTGERVRAFLAGR